MIKVKKLCYKERMGLGKVGFFWIKKIKKKFGQIIYTHYIGHKHILIQKEFQLIRERNFVVINLQIYLPKNAIFSQLNLW